jgi:hypothetical protein
MNGLNPEAFLRYLRSVEMAQTDEEVPEAEIGTVNRRRPKPLYRRIRDEVVWR